MGEVVWLRVPEINKGNIILLILIVITLAIPSYFTYAFTKNNPEFCTSCHLKNTEHENWNQNAMHGLDCHECHESGLLRNLDHAADVIFENHDSLSENNLVNSKSCEKCHASYNYQWKQVRKTEGHQVHIYLREQDRPNCVDCHGLNLHIFTPPEDVCVVCHTRETSMNTPEESIHCMDCHEFSERVMFPASDDCINCHDFARSQYIMEESLHDMQDETDCKSCHSPFSESIHEDCVECHESLTEGQYDYTGHQTCVICHSSHLSIKFRETCLSCHNESETHYTDTQCNICHSFHREEMSMITPEDSVHCMDCHEFSDPEKFYESSDCINCHNFDECQYEPKLELHEIEDETDCMTCHNPHTESMYKDCVQCHQESAGGLHDNSNHHTCTLCHVPHKSIAIRENCLSCHINKETHYPDTKCVMCHSFTS